VRRRASATRRAPSRHTSTFADTDEDEIMPTYPDRFDYFPPRLTRIRTADDVRQRIDQATGDESASPRAETHSHAGQSKSRAHPASGPGTWQRHIADSRNSAVLRRCWHAFTNWCASRKVTWPIG
jgi:hypothetical protein